MVKIIKKYTELLDTEKLLNRNIFSLSGGEKQLMAITSVMTMDNQVYLFDEPSASLDHHSIGLLKKMHRRAETKRENRDNCRTQTVLSERDHGLSGCFKRRKTGNDLCGRLRS